MSLPPRPESVSSSRRSIPNFTAPHAPHVINVRNASYSESDDSEVPSERVLSTRESREQIRKVLRSQSVASSSSTGQRSRSNSTSSAGTAKLRRPSSSIANESHARSRKSSFEESQRMSNSSKDSNASSERRRSALEDSIEFLKQRGQSNESLNSSIPTDAESNTPRKYIRQRAGSSISTASKQAGSSYESLPLSDSVHSSSDTTTSSASVQHSTSSATSAANVTSNYASSYASSTSHDSESDGQRIVKRKSKSRDPHHSFPVRHGLDAASHVVLGLKKVRPGHKLEVKERLASLSPVASGELPPLPSSPVPRQPGPEPRKPEPSNKPGKLNIISPTTGASVCVAETDLFVKAANAVTQPQTHPNSASKVDPLATTGSPVATNLNDIRLAEQTERDEEQDRVRSLLTGSAAVSSSKVKRTKVDSVAVVVEANSASGGEKTSSAAAVYARAAENLVGPVIEVGEPEILFVDDGGKFRHLRKMRVGDENEGEKDSRSFDEQLNCLCVSINTMSSHILQMAHGIYAGLCLLSLSLFPTTIQLITPNVSSYTVTVQFVAFYSPVSIPVSRLFCVFGTLNVLAALDGGFDAGKSDGVDQVGKWWKSGRGLSSVGAVRWWRRRSGRMKRVAWFIATIFASISYILSVCMIPVDDRLYESQFGLFGGYYGKANWFTNLTTTAFGVNPEGFTTTETTVYNPNWLNTTFSEFYPVAGADIAQWQNLNIARGVFGVSGWMFASLARMMVARKKGKHASTLSK